MSKYPVDKWFDISTATLNVQHFSDRMVFNCMKLIAHQIRAYLATVPWCKLPIGAIPVLSFVALYMPADCRNEHPINLVPIVEGGILLKDVFGLLQIKWYQSILNCALFRIRVKQHIINEDINYLSVNVFNHRRL